MNARHWLNAGYELKLTFQFTLLSYFNAFINKPQKYKSPIKLNGGLYFFACWQFYFAIELHRPAPSQEPASPRPLIDPRLAITTRNANISVKTIFPFFTFAESAIMNSGVAAISLNIRIAV